MFKDNIDAPTSEDQKDLNNMVEEGKRMGLDPADLGVGEEGDDSFGTRQKDPLNPDKPTGLNQPDDEEDDQEPQKPAEKKPTAKKPEADEEGEEGDEDDDTSDEGEGDGKPSTDSKGKFVTQAQLGKFGRGIKQGFKDLAGAIEKLADAKSPTEKKEAKAEVAAEVDEFMTYAQKYKDAEGNPMNADALKELAGLIEKQVLGKVPLDQIKGMTDLQPVVSKMSEDISREEQQTFFNTEWEGEGTKFVKDKYPNATADQVTKAKQKMFELATSEKYGFVEGKHEAYPLDYILLKEAETFKDLLYSPRRKTAESSQLGDDGDDLGADDSASVLSTSFENMTPKKAREMEAALDQTDGDDFY